MYNQTATILISYATLFTALLVVTSQTAFGQIVSKGADNDSAFTIHCMVDVVDASMAISPSQAMTAKTISDLNPYYKPSWVKTYNSVMIETTYHGTTRRAKGISDTLTAEQKQHISNMDDGSSINIDIRYIPDNDLSNNDEKALNYTIPVYPGHDAKYPGGQKALNDYLRATVLSLMDSSEVKQHQQYSVQFVVDEVGDVVDPVFQFSSEDETLDSLLMHSVCNMPKWTPARLKSGKPVSQRHALILGDRYSCTENLINARSTVQARVAQMSKR